MRLFWLITLLIGVSPARAFDFPTDLDAAIAGTNLNVAQMDSLFKTLGSVMAFRPLEPAGSKGAWSLSFGLEAGGLSGSQLQEAFPQVAVPSHIPTADLVLVLQTMRSLAFELGIVPGIKYQENSLTKLGFGVKWTASEVFLGERPAVDFAIRGMLSFPSMTVKTGTAQADYSSSVMGLNLSMSKRFGVVEPYAGIGLIQQTSTLTASGSANVFGTSISLSAPLENSYSSPWLFLGTQFSLGPVDIGLEYTSMYSIDMATLKLSFRIGPFGSEPRTNVQLARRRGQPPQQQQRAPAGQRQPAPRTGLPPDPGSF